MMVRNSEKVNCCLVKVDLPRLRRMGTNAIASGSIAVQPSNPATAGAARPAYF
jgi:hypothetical protein